MASFTLLTYHHLLPRLALSSSQPRVSSSLLPIAPFPPCCSFPPSFYRSTEGIKQLSSESKRMLWHFHWPGFSTLVELSLSIQPSGILIISSVLSGRSTHCLSFLAFTAFSQPQTHTLCGTLSWLKQMLKNEFLSQEVILCTSTFLPLLLACNSNSHHHSEVLT